jgi:hypothetical protein
MRAYGFENLGFIENLKPGDRVHLHAPEDFRSDWLGPRDFDITVSYVFLDSMHGPRIFSVEKIPNGEDFEDPDWNFDNDWHLADDWEITPLPPLDTQRQNG